MTAAGLGLGLTVASAGCSHDEPATAPTPQPSAPTATVHAPPDVVKAIGRALDRRETAVRTSDQTAFDAGVAPGLRPAQDVYLANLRQLPLRVFSYTLDPASLVRTRHGGYWATVAVHLQLDGYDDRPVTTPDRYLFTPVRHHPGRFVVASVTDAAWERRNHVHAEPWDQGPVRVLTAPGVLGVFDERSVAAAPAVLRSAESGISAVAARVPYDWSRSVVVYALSDETFLRSLDGLPGDDPDTLDGVAVPVMAGPGSHAVASTRVVLNPRQLGAAPAVRDRLLRHEITHVAVGSHDDDAPVWLSEGLAEWVSVQPLAPQERRIAPAAVAVAERGITAMPRDDGFNDGDAAVHYGTAWWACEYLARSFGAPVLWSLLDAMDRPDADPDRVLRQQVGISTRELARKAGKLIVATFDPPRPSPSASPSASGSGSPSPSPGPSSSTSSSTSAGPSGSASPSAG
ncbi:MAG: hypothetical protein ACXVWZ_12690 [Nocardioides sp.]